MVERADCAHPSCGSAAVAAHDAIGVVIVVIRRLKPGRRERTARILIISSVATAAAAAIRRVSIVQTLRVEAAGPAYCFGSGACSRLHPPPPLSRPAACAARVPQRKGREE